MKKMFSLCKKGIGLNFLSVKCKEDDGLAYYSPISILLIADKISRNWVINHDFKNDQFSVFIYKGSQRLLPWVEIESAEESMGWLLRNQMHEKVLEMNPEESSPLCDIYVAIALLGVGKSSEAVEILQFHTDNPLGVFYLAYAYLGLGQKEKAMGAIVKARLLYADDKPVLKVLEKMEGMAKKE